MYDVFKYLNSLNLTNHDNVVVAVSGGPDSMCLLNILVEYRNKFGFNIVCAHVNHSLRKQSEEEKVYVQKYCEENDIKFEYLKINNYDDSINFHAQARDIRYNFFDNCVKKYCAKYLFLAHHGDDLIETVLMRITRGSNALGYSGFSACQKRKNYFIVRPLIFVTKDDIYNYLNEKNVKYYVDESNFKDVYTRNRYRKYVLPFLKSEYKNIHKKYIEFSETIRKQEEYIDNQVNKKYMNLVINDVLKVDKFIVEDDIIKEKIIYLMLSDLYKNNINLITKEHISNIISLIMSNKPNLVINLPIGYYAVKEYNKFYITLNDSNSLEFKYELYNDIETDTYTIKTLTEDDYDTSNYTIRLDSKDVSLPLYIRNRKQGDIIEVKGLNGHKKVKDIFIDSKIPSKKRDSIPILVDKNDKILCIFGIKKSKYDKQTNDFYDIIVKCIKKKEESYEK